MLVGVAASRTETFRDQNHRLQSKFAYCKLFGVYAGVIFVPKKGEDYELWGTNSWASIEEATIIVISHKYQTNVGKLLRMLEGAILRKNMRKSKWMCLP